MGMLDFLTGTKKPAPGTPVLSIDEVKSKILALNRPTAPYQIVDGQSEGADLIAEWNIVDAKWYEIFAKAGLQDSFKVYLKLHPENNEVRALDKRFKVEWRAGVPTVNLSASLELGQQTSFSMGSAYAFTEDLGYGQVYNYRFNSQELKGPLQKAVTDSGWTYKGVVPPATL